MGILRSLFGPSREEVWRKLAEQIGAEYVDGGFWKPDKVVVQYGEWTVTLDYFSTGGKNSRTFTRMRAPFVNADGFQFSVHETGLFTGVAEALGFHDIEIGDSAFDADYVIKGNDDEKVRALFASPELRELIRRQRNLRFQVKGDEGWFGAQFPEGVDELYFVVCGIVRDVDQLRALFGLFAETLDRLCHIGSAYENDPQVTL